MKQIIENLLQIQALEMDSSQNSIGVTEIQKLRKRVPVQLLKHYDQRRLRGKQGVAIVRNGVCCQCHMQVASGLFASLLRLDDQIYSCQNCGAYLSVVVDEPKEAPIKIVKPRRAARTRLVVAPGVEQLQA